MNWRQNIRLWKRNSRELYLPEKESARLSKVLLTMDESTLITFDRYSIKSGDTLGAIARKFGTRVDVLQRANSLNGSRIIAGESLLVPRGEVSDFSPPNIKNNDVSKIAPTSYTVRRGDNLWSIARRYNLYSADIVRLNNLSDGEVLQPGQRLLLRNARENAVSTTNSD